jgi:uroporphyrinogen-III synthase
VVLGLQGLEVLITRPRGAAEVFSAQLQALGAYCRCVPVMQITEVQEPSQRQRIKSLIMDFDRYQIAIFISQNAVHFGLEWIDQYWPQLPQDTRYLAIGSATAKGLNRYITAQIEVADQAMNSENLLELPSLKDVAGKKVLIFRGIGGRETLAKSLLERGAEVDYCELYSRQVPSGLALRLSETQFGDGLTGKRRICVHSGESLHNLEQSIDDSVRERWHQTPLLVPGERVAELAYSLGYCSVVVATNASDRCVIDTIQRWYSS